MSGPSPKAADARQVDDGTGLARMVELHKVSKSFGAANAVNDVSLELGRGRFLTILGPSGCGKTTLLRMIAGFIEPSAGEIYVNGQLVGALPPHARSIGMVFQRLALFPHMTAAQNIAYPLKMRRFPVRDIAERVERYLELVQLDGLGSRRPHELSGGQQQRVAIARALVFEPDLLLLDEPLAALDKKLREEMQLEFRRIQRELGVTTINVTHDQREALVMSDRVVVMNAGEVQQAEDPVTLYRAPGNRFVAGFIGLTAFFKGRLEREGIRVGATVLQGRDDGREVEIGAMVECAVRAEQVRIARPGVPSGEFDNTVAGRVVERIFEGDRVVYEIACAELDGAIVYAFDHDPLHHDAHSPGDEVVLAFNARDLMVFD